MRNVVVLSGERTRNGRRMGLGHISQPQEQGSQLNHAPFALLTRGCESRWLYLGLWSQDRHYTARFRPAFAQLLSV